MRVFNPLKPEHPLIVDDQKCSLCRQPFVSGQRIMLIPARIPTQGVENVPCAVAHASCCLHGMHTPVGVIDRIKDGDASPFPVLTTDGKQWKLEEAGLET